MNRNIITVFVILARSTLIAFLVRSVNILVYSCNVSSCHCFLLRSLAASTSAATGQCTFNIFLISGQLLVQPICFNTFRGLPVDLATTNSLLLTTCKQHHFFYL